MGKNVNLKQLFNFHGKTNYKCPLCKKKIIIDDEELEDYDIEDWFDEEENLILFSCKDCLEKGEKEEDVTFEGDLRVKSVEIQNIRKWE